MPFAGGDGLQGRKTRCLLQNRYNFGSFYGWETSFTVYPKHLRFYAPKLPDIYRTAMLARGMDLFLLCHHKTFSNDKPVCDVIEGLEQPLSLVWLYNKFLLVSVTSTACKGCKSKKSLP